MPWLNSDIERLMILLESIEKLLLRFERDRNELKRIEQSKYRTDLKMQ